MPKDNKFNTEGLLQYWYSKRDTWPNLTKMRRQFHGCPATSAGVERLFFKAGKQHDDLKKRTEEETIERNLKVALNTKVPDNAK